MCCKDTDILTHVTRWRIIEVMPFTKYAFYKGMPFTKWRLLKSDAFYKVMPFIEVVPFVEVAPLTEVTPFIKVATLTTVAPLTEVMPGTDVMNLADVMHCTGCACCLFLWWSWYLSIVCEYYNQQIYLIFMYLWNMFKNMHYLLSEDWPTALPQPSLPPIAPPSLTPPLHADYIKRKPSRADTHLSSTYIHFLTELSYLWQQSLKMYTQGNTTEFH